MNAAGSHKERAMQFLQLVVAGRIDEAYERYVDMSGRHHNPSSAAGFPALKQAMVENHAAFPEKRITIRNVISDGNLVAVHSHVELDPGDKHIAVVHIFRFSGKRITEMWDIGQPLPGDAPNNDGAF